MMVKRDLFRYTRTDKALRTPAYSAGRPEVSRRGYGRRAAGALALLLGLSVCVSAPVLAAVQASGELVQERTDGAYAEGQGMVNDSSLSNGATVISGNSQGGNSGSSSGSSSGGTSGGAFPNYAEGLNGPPSGGGNSGYTPTTTTTTTPPAAAYDPSEGGIHQYDFFVDDCTWTEAFQKAQKFGGYLARINSKEEYTYIKQQIAMLGLEKIQFRIGGRRDSGSYNYYWVDKNNKTYGNALNAPAYWAYSEWMTGEPSFWDGSTEERFMDIMVYSQTGQWVWNDVTDDILSYAPFYSGILGYIVEYEY